MLPHTIIRRVGFLSFVFAQFLAASTANGQPVLYRLIALGPADAVNSLATGINDSGVVSGGMASADFAMRAMRSNDDRFELIPELPGGSLALAINANGGLAGSFRSEQWQGMTHAYRYTSLGAVEDLGPFVTCGFGQAVGINRLSNRERRPPRRARSSAHAKPALKRRPQQA